MSEYLWNLPHQHIADHAAAHGGEQRHNYHAQNIQALAKADQIAGNGKGGGADDVDDVGGVHGAAAV